MRTFFLVLASALLYALAFPPWSISPLAWIALVPLLRALSGARPLRGMAIGFFWGCITIWAVAFWVPPALMFYYQQPWWFGLLFCIVGCAILWGSYYAVFGFAAAYIAPRTTPLERSFLIAALWVSCELGRSRLLTGEPWMLLGYALSSQTVLIQAADLGSVYLLSFALALANACVAEALADAPRIHLRPIAAAFGVAAVLFFYGQYRLAQELPQEPRKRVLVVQGNNDMGLQWRETADAETLTNYLALTERAVADASPDLIIWPESAVTFFLAREPDRRAAISRLLRQSGSDLLVGAPHYEDVDPAVPRFFNSAFHLSADGAIVDRYDKAHLLPFAEYFPLRTVDFLRRRFERVRYFTAGTGTTLLDTPIGRVGVAICFEAIFPDLIRRQVNRGADVLVNLSNDAWLGSWAGPEQHVAMVALRAVENRTWVVRATTTGISAVIDPFGRTMGATETSVATTISATIVPMRVTTPYEQLGDLFAYLCLAGTVVGLFLIRRREPGSANARKRGA